MKSATAPTPSPAADVYIYSPSGAVRDRAAFKRGVRALQGLGCSVAIDPAALASHQRFAGDDATRLDALMRAARSGAALTLITRGGYGLSRLLDQLPYKEIAQSIRSGTRWVGLSDFTALQLATWAHTGAITWAGPALLEGFGATAGLDPIAGACFEDLWHARSEGTGWRMRPTAARNALDSIAAYASGTGDTADFVIEDAPLWGGNLSMVCSLLGTPHWPVVEGGILFLEDVGEHPYRIERMLMQLEQAGVLARQRAILLGAFNQFQPVAHDRGFGLKSVWAGLRARLRIPLLEGLPFGHVPTKVLLPVGARVSLQVQGPEVLLLWGHHPLH